MGGYGSGLRGHGTPIDCMLCGRTKSRYFPVLCPGCLEGMREALGIDEYAIAEAIRRGFFRPPSLMENLDRGLRHLDQAEISDVRQ